MPQADGLTDGLEHLKFSIDKRFPNRDKQSDGSWGDKAHQAETSGHNPDDTKGSKPEWNGDSDTIPEVRSWDQDSDLRDPEITAQMLVDHIRKLPNVSSVIRYMIYNRKIYHSLRGWVAEDYDGASAHTEHIHYTGAWTNAADINTKFDYQLEKLGDPMPTPDDLWNADVITNPKQRSDSPLHTPKGTNVNTSARFALGDMWRLIENMNDAIVQIQADIKVLKEGSTKA